MLVATPHAYYVKIDELILLFDHVAKKHRNLLLNLLLVNAMKDILKLHQINRESRLINTDRMVRITQRQ